MIQFNLLPDVKLEYIKARRTKHLVLLISVITTGVTVGITVMLFIGVGVVQKRHLGNLSKEIKEKSEQLKNEKDIDKILTVQNQLNNIGGLHDTKPAAERLGGYLEKVTPNEVAISKLAVDFTANTMAFEGKADSLKSVNKFVDTLKFSEYSYSETGADGKPVTTTSAAFSSVVLADFNRSDSQDGQAVSYKITLSFDPLIFDLKKNITLQIPKGMTTTRSVTERPKPLFQPNTSDKNGEEGR